MQIIIINVQKIVIIFSKDYFQKFQHKKANHLFNTYSYNIIFIRAPKVHNINFRLLLSLK